jgi:hypothetical protein
LLSRVTVNIALAGIRKKQKEVYIRQTYDFGDRLEYDFAEVLLNCGEGMKTYHMAVFSSPAFDFRWLYLYTNQKKDVFMDSHVKFLEMMGVDIREIVYDNMKNVVSKSTLEKRERTEPGFDKDGDVLRLYGQRDKLL